MSTPMAAAAATLVNWGSVGGELRGALAVAVLFAAIWMVIKVAKGDVAGFAKILGCAFLGVLVLGLLLLMSSPERAGEIVNGFLR
jgi:predicted membrane protein